MANNAAIKPTTGPAGPGGSTGATGPLPDMMRFSSTSIAIGLGAATFTFTVATTNLGWLIGTRLRAASGANPAVNYMDGNVTAVSTTQVTIVVDLIAGSGTHADWSLVIVGAQGYPGTIASRGDIAHTTASLANGGIETSSFTLAKSYAIVKITVDHACRLRLYSTAAQATADVSRSLGTPPQAGTAHGVILDIYLDGTSQYPLSNFICSPEVYGANVDSPAVSTGYYSVTNLSGGSTTITFTLTTKIEEA